MLVQVQASLLVLVTLATLAIAENDVLYVNLSVPTGSKTGPKDESSYLDLSIALRLKDLQTSVSSGNKVVRAPTAAQTPAVNKTKTGSVSLAVCLEYSHRFEAIDAVATTAAPPSFIPFEPGRKKRCENVQKLNVIQDADPREFPNLALVGYGLPPKWRCSASLLSEKFLITSASCQKDQKLGPAHMVLLGDLNVGSHTDDAKPQLYKIKRLIVHPDYQPESLYHNLMLIETEDEVQFNEYIRPNCIHDIYPIVPTTGLTAGWAATEKGGPPNPALQKIETKFLTNDTCSEAYKSLAGTRQLKDGIDYKYQICMGGVKGRSICQGGAGAPLQLSLGNCLYYQIGVLAFGKSCGSGSPDVFTRLAHYAPWIEKIVWPDSDTILDF